MSSLISLPLSRQTFAVQSVSTSLYRGAPGYDKAVEPDSLVLEDKRLDNLDHAMKLQWWQKMSLESNSARIARETYSGSQKPRPSQDFFFFLRSTCTSNISDKRRLPPAKRRAASFLFPSCDTRAGYHRVASRTIGYQLEILLMLSDIACHRLQPFNPMQSVPDY